MDSFLFMSDLATLVVLDFWLTLNMENLSPLISFDPSSGRVMVLASKELNNPLIRLEGKWLVGTFSADDLKDNFERVPPGTKEFDTFFYEAKIADKVLSFSKA